MKRTLYQKMLFGFLLFAIFGFLIVAVFTSRLSFEKLQEDEVKNLYEAATTISSNLTYDSQEGLTTDKNMEDSLSYLSHYLDSRIWIIDPEGKVYSTFTPDGSSFSKERIEGFHAEDFGTSRFLIGDFYGYFNSEYLSVIASVNQGNRTCGYVLIHKPLDTFYAFHNELLNISYLSWGLLVLFAAVLFIFFSLLVYRPIRTLSIGAKEYAKGNYSNPILVRDKDDELGYIAASLNYMAGKLDTIKENQRNFISNVSHDFRSPLTSIHGYIDAFLDGTIPPEMQEKYLKIILFETERLTKLTESLLE